MQYFSVTTVLLGLLVNLSQASPMLGARQESLSAIADAQNQWAADTSAVSQFLSAAPTLSGEALAMAASSALASEKDELIHKAVLDAQFVFVANPDPSVQQANAVLVDQKTFMLVITGLTYLASHGATLSADQIRAEVLQINTDRCNMVLPAIDTYFRASGALLNNGVVAIANRPTNCP